MTMAGNERSTVIEEYLQAKYTGGGPGSDRFEPDPNEVHASHVSDCQRKRWWKHENEHSSDPSPYFELGRVYEVLYGAALAYRHDPGITADTLKELPPWEVVEETDRVVQDVDVVISDRGDFDIVGECDWVVLTDEAPAASDPHSPPLDQVRVEVDGSRTYITGSGDGKAYDPGWVEKVVETKTKKDVDWVRKKGPDDKHVYQVYPYMNALRCDGELAYMQRNDWEELVVPVEYDEARWLDVVVRASQHHANLAGDELPPTSPLDDGECRWCPFQGECRVMGGSVWQ